MEFNNFSDEVNMKGKFLSVILTDEFTQEELTQSKACTLSALKKAFDGETLVFTNSNFGCPGGRRGFGFSDEIPNIPGGFGNFIAQGAGKGFPPGERVKCNSSVGEDMMRSQPTDVLKGKKAMRIKPYEQDDSGELVTMLVNPDQLSAMIHLFTYRNAAFDNVIAPMLSGCASLFRIPLAELKTQNPRGVIGNIDIFSRPHFEKDTFFFTVPMTSFREMLADADECFFISHVWKGVKKRL